MSNDAVHLVKRFFTSLLGVGPTEEDTDWVEEELSPSEFVLWQSMSGADRSHSVKVAKRTQERLGNTPGRSVLAAALLHDVGKVISGLKTYERAIATLAFRVSGDKSDEWVQKDGFTRQVGLYLQHPQIGAQLLKEAGSAPLTIAWALEHHMPRETWTIPREIADALKAADDE